MLIQRNPNIHLTYCLNVHPGETWAENLEAIRAHALAVRGRVCPDRPFGLGLRLSAEAARALSEPAEIESFRNLLREENLYVFTINGFPYGRFHGARVKEQVYQPDWRDPRRRDYTIQLADILADLLPDGTAGSISTVPGSFKTLIQSEADRNRMAEMLCAVAEHLAGIERETGRFIQVGLEPEPSCFIETTDEFITFYNNDLLACGCAPESLIRRHIGVCLDTCHAALQFEDVSETLARYDSEGIRVSKIQISAALEAANTAEAREALWRFDEPVYLHQVRALRTDGRLAGWTDLGGALADLPKYDDVERLRVHFHVPLFWGGDPVLQSTRGSLPASLASDHLEIETYTLDVLPPDLRPAAVSDAISREYEWVRGRFQSA